MHKNIGRLKEDEFVKTLDGKKPIELSHNLKHILREMFGLYNGDNIIKSELVEHYQKPDFFVEMNGNRKYISLKTGNSCVVAQEKIKHFIIYLRNFNISKRSQQTILLYHFGDGTMDGSGRTRLDNDLLKFKLANRIKELNEELNSNKELVKDFVIRSMFKGTVDMNIEADYIYHGDINYGVVCSKTQILKHIERRSYMYLDNPHIGPIQFRPHARYFGKEIASEKRRWRVDFFWTGLPSDLNYISERYDG